MGSNEFLDNTIPHWGKLQLARQQFESELFNHLAKETTALCDNLNSAGIYIANEITSDKRRDPEYLYYFGSSKIQNIRGLSLHKTEELRIELGYAWSRSPDNVQHLLPFCFLWFNFVDLKNPKTWQAFFDEVSNRLPETVFPNVWKGGAYFCFKDDTFCRSSIMELKRDLVSLISNFGRALPAS